MMLENSTWITDVLISLWPVLKVFIFNVLLPAGVVAIIFKFYLEKRIKSYQLKLEKYVLIAEPIAKMYSGYQLNDEYEKASREFCHKANELFFFSSDKVTRELLSLIKKVQNQQIYTQDIKPLIIAIREDLGLKSKSLENEKEFCMFQIKKNG